MTTARPTGRKPARKPPSVAEILRLGGLLLVFFVVGVLLLRWVTTPRYLGETLATWRTRLRAPDLETRRQALGAITHLGTASESAGPTVESLRELVLAEDDAATRASALGVLGGILAPARSDADGTLAQLRRETLDFYLTAGREDGQPARRQRAIDALANLVYLQQGPFLDDLIRAEYRPRVVALLLERVGVETGAARAALLARLETIRPLPAEAEAPLLAAWRAEEGNLRRAVVVCLLAIPNLTAAAVPALLDQLPAPDLTPSIVTHLQALAPAALPALREALGAGSSTRRLRVAQALLSLGSAGQTILLGQLTSPDAATVAAVTDAFRRAGADARPFLLSQRRHPDPATRAAVERLLVEIPEKPPGRPH